MHTLKLKIIAGESALNQPEGILWKVIMKLLMSLLLLSGTMIGCAGEGTDADDGSPVSQLDSMAITRVVAEEYLVLQASEEEGGCRASPTREAASLLSLNEGQKVKLVSLQERGISNNGDFWLHVYANGNTSQACYVLAEILVPIGSHPVVE